MTERAKFAIRMRKQVITTRNRAEVLLFVFVARYFLICHDVEVHPGPVNNSGAVHSSVDHPKDDATDRTKDKPSAEKTVSDDCTSPQCSPGTSVPPDMAAKILDAIEKQSKQFQSLQENLNSVSSDLSSIKSDIGEVKSRCEAIDKRCDQLDNQNRKLASTVNENSGDIEDLFDRNEESRVNMEKVSETVQCMQEEISSLKAEVDRLEGFSRRDNLRMYGVPSRGQGPGARGHRLLCQSSCGRPQQC